MSRSSSGWVSLDNFAEIADETALAMRKLGATLDQRQPYPIGDWATKAKIDRWYSRKQRERMSKLGYDITISAATNAYQTINYNIPIGTSNVTLVQYDTTSSDFLQYEREHRPPPREFNRYINASDLLEEFIEWVGQQGVKRGDFLELPVDTFIKWLVIRACEEDQEEPNVVLELPAPSGQPRCLGCQQFMPKATTIPLHGPSCAELHFSRQQVAAA